MDTQYSNQLGTAIEYQQCMCSWRNKTNMCISGALSRSHFELFLSEEMHWTIQSKVTISMKCQIFLDHGDKLLSF